MKKIYLLLLCMVMLSAIFLTSACGSGSEKNESNEKIVILNDFEDYKTGFEPLILANSFGKVQKNNDKKYVKSGNSSALLMPGGDPTDKNVQEPILKQPLHVLKNQLNFGDLKKVDLITAELYNDEQTVVEMGVQLQFENGLSDYMQYSLQKGWNTVAYNIHAEILNYSFNIESCQSILFIFNKLEKGADVPTLYLDDITIHIRNSEFKETDFNLKENEIISFDNMYQQYVVAPVNRFPKFKPTIGLNQNPNYVKEGMSLRVDIPADNGTLPTESYMGFDIIANYIAKTDMHRYSNDYDLTFWVYNASNHTQRLFLELYNKTGNKFFFKDTQLYIEPTSWKQFTYSFEKLNQGQLASDGTKSMGKIYISWKITDLPSDTVLFFDSFEVKKRADHASFCVN